MSRKDYIDQFAFEIAKRFAPEKIVLFGSQARGTATDDSDVDMLVIMDFDGRAAKKAAEIVSSIDPPFPVDLIVRRPEDVRRRIGEGDFFLIDIDHTGTILYEASHEGVAH